MRSRCLRELVECGEIDCAQLRDRGVEALDLRRQRARAAPRLERVRQRRDVGVGFGQLLGELRLGELRRLLLQLHVLDLDARRLELLVCGEACLLGRAKIRAQNFQAVARTRERLFGGRANGQLLGERRLDGRPVDRGAFARELVEEAALLVATRREIARAARELGDAVVAAALREVRLLRVALRGTHFLAAARERDLGFVAGVARGLARRELVVQGGLQVGDLRIDGGPLRLRLVDARGELARFLLDLRAPLLRSFRRLPKLQELELQVVRTPLLRRDREAFRVVRLLDGGKLGVDRVALHARFLGPRTRARHRSVELVELALARKHAVQLVIGREERDALRRDEMTRRRDERFADRQRIALGKRCGEIVAAAHAGEPVGDDARHVLALQAHLGEQCVVLCERCVACGCRRIGREAPRGCAPSATQSVTSSRRSSSSADRRSRNTASSASSQPSSMSITCHSRRGVVQSAIGEPAVDIRAVADPRLQRRERLLPRLEVRKRLAVALPCVAPSHAGAAAGFDGLLQRRRALPACRRGPHSPARAALRARGSKSVAGAAMPASSCARRDLRASRSDTPRMRALAPRLRDTHRLLGGRDRLLVLGERAVGGLHRCFERGQLRLRRLFAALGFLASCGRTLQRGLRRGSLVGERGLLARDGGDGFGQLRHLLRDARLRLARERKLLLEPRHFGVRRIERALLLVQRVAGGVVLAAQRLELRFRGADFRLDRFERHGERRDLRRAAVARPRGVLLLRVPQEVLRLREARFVLAVLRRDLRLLIQACQLVAELQADVLHAGEILARIRKPPFRFLATLLVLGNAGRFLEEHSKLLGLRFDDARDHALLDDRVRARTEPGAEEEVVDVAPADRDVVDVVRGIAVAREHALDRDLGVLTPLPADPAQAVVEMELDRSAADRLALAGAVEDHILHRLAAQRRGLGLAQHPAHGVDHVRLAAAVRADDADELAGRCDGRGIDERFETGELDLGEAQSGEPASGCQGKASCSKAKALPTAAKL